MAKKPIFISPGVEENTGTQKESGDPAPTRLYRDPAETTPPDLPSHAGDATRIIGSEPASPAGADDPAGDATRLVDMVAPAPEVTRVLAVEPVAETMETANETDTVNPVVGWLVVVDGPGRGRDLSFAVGMNAIGRGDGNDVVVDFGDDEIVSEAHAYIVYDEEGRSFHATHAGQNSVVRLNNEPLLEAKEVKSGDQLRIGQTTLRLVTLCGDDFDWSGD
ncbi:MAG: FHA domain-containing protein [Hyphomicrobiales bacterium]